MQHVSKSDVCNRCPPPLPKQKSEKHGGKGRGGGGVGWVWHFLAQLRPTFDFAYWAEHVDEAKRPKHVRLGPPDAAQVQANAENRKFKCDVARYLLDAST